VVCLGYLAPAFRRPTFSAVQPCVSFVPRASQTKPDFGDLHNLTHALPHAGTYRVPTNRTRDEARPSRVSAGARLPGWACIWHTCQQRETMTVCMWHPQLEWHGKVYSRLLQDGQWVHRGAAFLQQVVKPHLHIDLPQASMHPAQALPAVRCMAGTPAGCNDGSHSSHLPARDRRIAGQYSLSACMPGPGICCSHLHGPPCCGMHL